MKDQPSTPPAVAKQTASMPAQAEVRTWHPSATLSSKLPAEWRIKTYYAATMQSAMSQARAELGEDAIILSSRRTPEEKRRFGDHEVVVGTRPDVPVAKAESDKVLKEPLLPVPNVAKQEEVPPVGLTSLFGNVAEMRQQLRAIQEMLQQSGLSAPLPKIPSAKEWHSRLLHVGLPESMVMQVLRDAAATFQQFEERPDPVQEAVADALKKCFHTDSTLGVPDSRKKTVVLVGPPGCGKTTSLIKLAIREGMLMQIPTTLVSLDRDRIAAMQQMESYASILGLCFRQLNTVAALDRFVDDLQSRELVLVDTNGISSSDIDAGREMAEYLQNRKEIDVHLVLPANLRDSDLARTVDRFAQFSPKKLLFTMIDETESFGALVREANRTGKPISFLSKGREVPEDLERANPEGIARLVLRGRQRRAAPGASR